jgi:hypothetical protein
VIPDLEDFVRSFVGKLPALAPMLQQHSQDYAELLPHVFFAELAGWAEAAWDEPGARPQVQGLLDKLEEAFANGSSRIKEFIATGFLENLPSPGSAGDEISRALGPQLFAEWQSPGSSFRRLV